MAHIKYVACLVIVIHEPLLFTNPVLQVFTEQKQPHFKPFQYCTYWTVLGPLSNLNIIQL